ncbi:MAG: type II toxin-antitoxin system VapC family toxin [Planctomycetes bacterium]|nr:type II toxin-antitoxin system VapC family toxin [Planctomycetota bacterium]
MIVLDTHVWYWFLSDHERLSPAFRKLIEREQAAQGVSVSIISCWEIAQKVAGGKLKLTLPMAEWLSFALADPHLIVQPLTPQIVLDAAVLPPPMPRDPADRFIVATARALDCPLLTEDSKLVDYRFVRKPA